MSKITTRLYKAAKFIAPVYVPIRYQIKPIRTTLNLGDRPGKYHY